MAVPVLDLAVELLWNAGHPAIGEALQTQVDALTQRVDDERMTANAQRMRAEKAEAAVRQALIEIEGTYGSKTAAVLTLRESLTSATRDSGALQDRDPSVGGQQT